MPAGADLHKSTLIEWIKYSNIDKIVIEDDIMIVHIDSSVPLKLNIFLSNIQKQMFVLYLEQFKVNVECKK